MMDASAKIADPADRHGHWSQDGHAVQDTLRQAREHFDRMSKALEEFTEDHAEPLPTQTPLVPANFLDALPNPDTVASGRPADYISAVNSDDNGLYRMFLTVSP